MKCCKQTLPTSLQSQGPVRRPAPRGSPGKTLTSPFQSSSSHDMTHASMQFSSQGGLCVPCSQCRLRIFVSTPGPLTHFPNLVSSTSRLLINTCTDIPETRARRCSIITRRYWIINKMPPKVTSHQEPSVHKRSMDALYRTQRLHVIFFSYHG
ncbi:hypothetical protein CI102_5354 [Trichoderma harzianum]|nr:hypothetical protein CI102_5354 [Trichoderma harzianum]